MTDLTVAAQLKVNSRLQPAKDIQVAYSKLLSNTDPGKFEELKNNLLACIDAAEAEYYILNKEVHEMEESIPKWENEIALANKECESLQDELAELVNEKSSIEEQKKEGEELINLNGQVMKFNSTQLMNEIQQTKDKIIESEEHINVELKSNERRRRGFDLIEKGLKIFQGELTEDDDIPVNEEGN